MPSLPRLERRLLRDQAYDVLQAAIVAGDLAPGAPLHEADLAARLGFSRAPVRDALARLTADGLVETKPQSFTRVTPLVDREVRDAVVVVRAMHEVVVRAAVPRSTPDDVRSLTALNEAFATAVDRGDVEAAIEADDAFHDVPVRIAGNQAAAATIARYTPMVRRLERARFGDGPGAESVALHRRLITAFRRRDVDSAVTTTTRIWSALERTMDDEERP